MPCTEAKRLVSCFLKTSLSLQHINCSPSSPQQYARSKDQAAAKDREEPGSRATGGGQGNAGGVADGKGRVRRRSGFIHVRDRGIICLRRNCGGKGNALRVSFFSPISRSLAVLFLEICHFARFHFDIDRDVLRVDVAIRDLCLRDLVVAARQTGDARFSVISRQIGDLGDHIAVRVLQIADGRAGLVELLQGELCAGKRLGEIVLLDFENVDRDRPLSVLVGKSGVIDFFRAAVADGKHRFLRRGVLREFYGRHSVAVCPEGNDLITILESGRVFFNAEVDRRCGESALLRPGSKHRFSFDCVQRPLGDDKRPIIRRQL